tara:strand:- start:269 stop:820 length:552 start_codon:yes stop_codon:yes gene_type:complete
MTFINSILKQAKPKKCKECKKDFYPYNSLQSVCTPKCASEYAAKKVWAKEKKVMKAKAMSRTELLKIAQVTFNTYIRLRDKHLPCISCGSIADIQQHAGHYFSVGAYPALRFNEDNVNKQCVQCNNFLHGNLLDYDRALKVKIGLERYNQLYALKTSIFKPSAIEINDLIEVYKARIKELKQN